MSKIVHVVGTGTIGEPLIGLFADFKKYLGIDEITFHKRTPMTTERAKVNDEALKPGEDRFLQIVSCNTHNIAALVKTLSESSDHGSTLEHGRFVCLRRANDVSQDSSFAPAPSAGKHDDAQFGTHHARDASRLLETIGWKPRLFSSAMKLNTQYMHSLWFDLSFSIPMTKDLAMERLRANRRIAITEKRSSNQIFSFGRDHGYYGRILSQAVVAAPTLTVNGDRELIGFCFTPQDGNSLASSIAAALWLIDPGYDRRERLGVLDRFFFSEI